MKLLTDHAQWYDDIFDGEGLVFHRLAFIRGGLTKRAQLDLFDRLGLKTPLHGTVRSLAQRLDRKMSCVVYVDELEHRGCGKLLLQLGEAERAHPDAYATEFLPPIGRAATLRQVRFGRLGFWLEQTTRGEDWRSNVDDEERFLGRVEDSEPLPIPRVLWAIDFLRSEAGLFAIDFNTAPELSTLGEERAATREELRAELEQAPPEHLAQL